MGVVDVAGTMEQIEDLSCLSDGAKERVIATPTFVLFIVADGGVLRMTLGGNDGAVEVQRDACKAAGTQPHGDQFTHRRRMFCTQRSSAVARMRLMVEISGSMLRPSTRLMSGSCL